MNDYYDGAGLALFGAFFFILTIFAIAGYVLGSWFLMKIFDKAGVQGRWRAWVPVYNTMVFAKLGDLNPWLILIAIGAGLVLNWIPVLGPLISIAAWAVSILAAWRVGLKLQKEAAWVILYFFLPIVWLGILGFDRSRWNGAVQPAPWAGNSFLRDSTTWAGIPVQAGSYPAPPPAPQGYGAPGAFPPPAPGTQPPAGYAAPPAAYIPPPAYAPPPADYPAPPAGYTPPPAPPAGYTPPPAPPAGYTPPPAPPAGYTPPPAPPAGYAPAPSAASAPEPPAAPEPPSAPEPPAAPQAPIAPEPPAPAEPPAFPAPPVEPPPPITPEPAPPVTPEPAPPVTPEPPVEPEPAAADEPTIDFGSPAAPDADEPPAPKA